MPTRRSPVDEAEVVRASITPLRRFLRALTADQKKAFAVANDTTLFYLHQLASDPLPNPRLRFAKKLVETSRTFAKLSGTSPLTYDDLLVGFDGKDDDS